LGSGSDHHFLLAALLLGLVVALSLPRALTLENHQLEERRRREEVSGRGALPGGAGYKRYRGPVLYTQS